MKKFTITVTFAILGCFIFTACPKQFQKKESYKKLPEQEQQEEIEKKQVIIDENTPKRKASNRMVDKGILKMQSKQYDLALQFFQDSINVDSTNGIAYYYMAYANIQLEQTELALGLLDKAEALLQHKTDWIEKIQRLRSTMFEQESEEIEKESDKNEPDEF